MIEAHNWTPQEIGAIPLVQLQALFDASSQPRELSAAEQLALLNEKRAKKGLPPVQARKRNGRN